MTKYAKAIHAIVEESRAHMTAEQIFGELRKRYPGVVLATVYNNLNHLWEQGLIRKIPLEGMTDRYDRIQRHDHLVCRRCGRLMDIHLSDLTNLLQEQVHIPILSYDLKLMCICEECSRIAEEERRGTGAPAAADGAGGDL